VAIARALVCKPRLMLLDEPFSNIDTQVRMKLILEIRALLKQQGIGAIFVSHSKEEAFAFADRLALFRAGRIEQVGSRSSSIAAPGTASWRSFSAGSIIWRPRWWTATACRPSLEPSAVRSPMAARWGAVAAHAQTPAAGADGGG
jgi:ABC-type Fe3+/spermidine/putrescine transport system ATPase subunit